MSRSTRRVHNAQFKTKVVKPLLANGIKISMDSKGRALDNIFIERFWRTIKYEPLYLRSYPDGRSLHEGLSEYFRFYNQQRIFIDLRPAFRTS